MVASPRYATVTGPLGVPSQSSDDGTTKAIPSTAATTKDHAMVHVPLHPSSSRRLHSSVYTA